MQQIGQDVWVVGSPLRFVGLEVGARTTIIRLHDGRLFVHSPIAATPDFLQAARSLGEVAFLVAPNCFHHLFAADWKRAFPGAALFVAPGLERKRSDLDIAGVLSDLPEAGWAGSIDQVVLRGIPMTNEVVFFHRPSRTLIASDLAFNLGAGSPGLTRFVFRLLGAHGRLAPTFLERLLVRDRPAFRRSLQQILAWPFERVVVAHGEISERGGREALMRGYAWVLAEAG
jgi:Domain of unknown function (DUF4336)